VQKATRLATLLGINAVPGLGYLLAEWSDATVLILYWWETLFSAILLTLVVAMYRRQTRGSPDAPKDADYKRLRSKALNPTFVFTIAQAYFLGAALVLAFGWPLPIAGLWGGLAEMSAFLVIDRAIDLVGLRERQFSWIEGLAGRGVSRMIVMQFTVIFGAMASGFLGKWGLLLIFMAAKLVFDLAWWWQPHSEIRIAEPT